MKLFIVLAIIGFGITLGIIASYSIDFSENNIENNITVTSYDNVITIGTIHRDSAKMTDRYQPLAEYIGEQLSTENKIYKGSVNIIPSQEEMIKSLINHEIDIYFDSPLIGMIIAEQTEIDPFLLSWKEGEREYNTVFITSIDSKITFDNLYNKTIVFEEKESTSGFLLPTVHLQNAGYKTGLNNSEDFSYVFSRDDENTPIWILEGKGDVGATSNLDFESIPKTIKDKLKIIESTESIPRQMVFVGDHVEQQEKIKELLLAMDKNPKTLEIIDKISHISKFSEIEEKDLRNVIKLIEILQQNET